MNGMINPFKAEIYFDRPAFKNCIHVGGMLYVHDKDQSVSDVTEVISLHFQSRT